MTTYPNPEENPTGQSSRLAEDSPLLPPAGPKAPESPRRHPLKSFGLANFKAFGPNEQTIPLKPITLIYGPNSGGKSSILHFLLWMKDVVELQTINVHKPRAGGGFVDLGGFRQMRHGTTATNEVKVQASVTLDWNRCQHDIEFAAWFGESLGEPSLSRLEFQSGGKVILALILKEDAGLCLKVNFVDTEWLATYFGDKNKASEWMHEFEAYAQHFGFDRKGEWIRGQPETSPVRDPALPSRNLELPGKIWRFLWRFDETVKDGFYGFSYLGPLRAYPPRAFCVADLPTERDPEGLFAWRVLFEEQETRERVNEWLRHQAAGCEIVADHRVSLEQVHEILWKECKKWGHDRDLNGCDTRDIPQAFAEAIWELPQRVTSASTGSVFLRDRKTGKHVTSRDIGVGLSQLIPVIAYAFSGGGLTVIEQPELHVHPALQAELGDVFIESALQRGNTFLLETHSEHLILRIMRRIRETTRGKLPEGKQPIRPEDVCILYVEPTESGSIVREMPLNEHGELTRAWPGGFFEESFNELF